MPAEAHLHVCKTDTKDHTNSCMPSLENIKSFYGKLILESIDYSS